MSRAAISLVSLLSPATPGGQAAADALPTAAGVYALGPLVEPAIAGEMPVAPDLVEALTPQYPTSAVRTAAGHARTLATDTRGRARLRLTWTHLGVRERQMVRDAVINTVGHTRRAIDLRPDGPGGGVLRVRMLGEIAERMVDTGGFQSDLPPLGALPLGMAAPREAAIYTMSVDVEEVFA